MSIKKSLVFIHIVLGLLLGTSFILFHMVTNGKLQQYCEQKLQTYFRTAYNCNFTCKLDHVDWLAGNIFFSQVAIHPLVEKQEDWSIQAEQFILNISWWMLLTSLKAKLSGTFDHLLLSEQMQDMQNSRLLSFLQTLFVRNPGGRIVYDMLHISDALLLLHQKESGFKVSMSYASSMSCERDSVRMQFHPRQGEVWYQDQLLLKDIAGSFVWDFPEHNMLQNMYISLNMHMHVVPLQQKGSCVCIGKLNKGKGSFALQNQDSSFVIDPIDLIMQEESCLMNARVKTQAEVFKQLGLYDLCKDMYGTVYAECNVDLFDFLKTFKLSVFVDDVAYKQTSLLKNGKLLVSHKDSGKLCGTLTAFDKDWFDLVFSMQSDGITCEVHNSNDIYMPNYWTIPAKGFCAVAAYDAKQGWQGYYKADFCNNKLQETEMVSGTCSFVDSHMHVSGTGAEIDYQGIFQIAPQVVCKKFICKKDKKVLLDFYADEKDKSHLKGMVDFLCMQKIMPETFKGSFTQDGSFLFEGYVKDGVYYSQVKTNQANIRIPRVYNVIQNVTATCQIDIYNKSLLFKDINAELHEGKIACSQATYYFDSSMKPSFIHAPLLLHNVMLSWDKGIFMLLSGRLLLTMSEQDPLHLDGQVIVEKSQVKDNLFSSDFQERLFGSVLEYEKKESFGPDCTFNVSFFTKDLLQVRTSFLSAKARIDMLLHGSLKKPELSGLIQLVSGSFSFPYKPLDIVDGKLFFIPDQQLDPLIEVSAKGKLKKHQVSMRVFGSVFDPHVQFEAMPFLTEEQIVSLLLLGIQDSSLGVMVPAILTQKLTDIIFGPAISKTNLDSRFNRLLNVLKYFRFLPQFTNQSGRGGVRGVFEVDASDHIHGKIDTNFMQLEDTKFDMDFALTDEVTLRMEKDGPSTYGGEVELRWKFG